MKGTCSICGKVVRTHASKRRTARQNFLIAMRKHQWGEHRTTMIARIKAGKQRSVDNPTVQDFISALQGAPQRAIAIYTEMRKKDWMQLKRVMDAIEGLLNPTQLATWKAVEAVHDAYIIRVK